ncbi:MAG: MBL fold metallo-hydrolase RNA specificity domain-containing protein [Desulfatiglandales bacterium]
MVKVTCLGGVGTVTGSCYLVESAQGKGILVECGLFQGGRQMDDRNREDWAFDPKKISTIFLTHAHIDHCGRIPKLVKDGFQGRIITSPPTVELCNILLLDAAYIQEMEAEWQTRKNKRKAYGEILPLYTTQDAEAAIKCLRPVERDQIIEPEPGIRARLRNAGHILGSSTLELWVEEDQSSLKVVFSGDLGKKDQLIVRDPYKVFDADYLFLESTYGNRLHRSFEASKAELLEAIEYATSRGEKTMIPAFAVERTQEILYVLGQFHRQGRLPDIPIFLDSPLAIKATRIFRDNKEYYDEDALAIVNDGFDPFDMPNLHFTETTQESIAINKTSGPAIVIAGSGMCNAGRIKHHLKHNLWREGSSLVICGFQAQGTTGRRIVDGAKFVKIFGENVAAKAKVFTIGGFSAHADQRDLLEWVGHFESDPKIFLVHGESTASEVLAKKIEEVYGMKAHIPRWKERLILKPKEMVVEQPTEPEGPPDFQSAMLNAIVDLESEIKKLRRQIKDAEVVSRNDVDLIEYLREELKAARESMIGDR